MFNIMINICIVAFTLYQKAKFSTVAINICFRGLNRLSRGFVFNKVENIARIERASVTSACISPLPSMLDKDSTQ